MNHQPFEEWLLSKEALTQEQEAALHQHLQDCLACTHLAAAWQTVEHEIKQAPLAAPAPGFNQRWQARMAEKRARMQRRLAWWMIGINLSAALGIFLALNWNRLASLSFTNLLVTALFSFTLLSARIESTEALVKILFTEVNPLIPLGMVSFIGCIVTLLCLIWIASMFKIFIPQGARNEARD